MVTAAYGELAGEQMRELERHMGSCAECHQEWEQLLALKFLADANPVLEPEANLVARSRLRLEEALDALPPWRWYERLGQRLMNNFANLQAAPAAACLLLAVGAGAGLLGGYRVALDHMARTAAIQMAQGQTQPASTAATAAPGGIANFSSSNLSSANLSSTSISSIARQPGNQMVEVRYNQVVPQRIEGSLNDPAIRQLLMLASQNSASAKVRNDSVALLADECRAGHGCQAAGTGIRHALLAALRNDVSARVREKALKGLEPYVAEDVRVRDAVLQALMNDGNPRIRTRAINILGPVEADTSVRQVLHTVADSDQNPYIRTVSQQVLDNEPEIQ
jgi:anti-sigma factor RsiW